MSEAPSRKRRRGEDCMEGVLREIEEIAEKIKEVEDKIKEVDEQIKKLETKLDTIPIEIGAAVNQDGVKNLRVKRKLLIYEKMQLRDNRKELVEEKRLLMVKEIIVRYEKRRRLDNEPMIWESIGSIQFDSDTPWREDRCLKLQLAEEAGLSPATLFIHHHAKDLWNFLNDKRKKCALILGCPGVGKSSVVLAWVCWMVVKENKNVLWIHYDTQKLSHVVNFKRDGCTKLKLPLGSELVPDLGCYDLVVLDGIVQSTLSIQWYDYSQSLILVSLVGLKLRDEHFSHTEEFILESWTLSDYQNACNNEAIYDTLPKDSTSKEKAEIIEERFYFAGHCARYFFGYSLSAIQSTFNTHIESASSSTVQYTSTGIHTKAKDTVHLLAIVNGKTTLCSSYVCQKLMFEHNFNFLKDLLEWCKQENSLLEGQVFKLAFLAYLKAVHGRKIPNVTSIKLCKSVDKPGVNEFWDIKGGYCHFEPTKMDAIPAVEWLIPKKFKQPTYDSVQLKRDENMLRLVQLTRAKSHTIKCKYVIDLLQALGLTIKVLDFVILFPIKGTKPTIMYEDKLALQAVLNKRKISSFGSRQFSVRVLLFNTQLLFD